MRNSVLLAALALSSCSVGPVYEKPSLALPTHWPTAYPWEKSEEQLALSTSTPMQAILSQQWWQAFHDPALSQLIEEGIAANADFLLAAARVAEARAITGVQDADLYPTLNLQGEATRISNSRETSAPGALTSSKPFNRFSIATVLNYELDLWGKLRHASASARAQLLAAEATRDAIRLAIASDIATSYFNLRALDAQIAITEQEIQSRTKAYHYQKNQYHFGQASPLAYKQAEAELAAVHAQLPGLMQAREEQLTSLSILLGRDPKRLVESHIERGHTLELTSTPPSVPNQLPSTLLERRPDIQSAEQMLISANADIGVVKADYFPTLSLSALLGLSSRDADRLLHRSARNWQAGIPLAGPLIDFGRTSGNVDAAEARKDQALIEYQNTVRKAFKEVLDAMSYTKTTHERVKAQTLQVAAYAAALKLAESRYKIGYANYLELLDAQRSLYRAQLDRVIAQRDRVTASVILFKALGGGWKSNTLHNNS